MYDNSTLQPGDVIRVWCYIFWHYGVYLGDGQVMVHAGSSRGGRVCRQGLAEFDPNGTSEVLGWDFSRKASLARALWAEGQCGYNLFTANCEHFAKWCAFGRKSSVQSTVLGSAAIGLGLWLLWRLDHE